MRRVTTLLVGATMLMSVAGLAAARTAEPDPGPVAERDGRLAQAFRTVDRDTEWSLVDRLDLDFDTFHTQGLAVTPDHLFLSSVEILEPTRPYPEPVNGYDRTPGKGVGHLFVMDRQGNLQKDIVLGRGRMYHPGGIDFDGRAVWVPVAQYRPDSSALLYRVDATSLRVTMELRIEDHIGGVVLDRTTGHLVGNTWGSRRFYEWTRSGTRVRSWANNSYFIDYQDCQYVAAAKMLCGGVTNLPQTPAAGGSEAVYELGGMALVDLHSHRTIREVPFQKWSSAGHVMTRNPLELAAGRRHLDLWAAPDNGDEGNGTEVFHYRASVPPAA